MSMTVEALAQEIISGHIIGPFNAKAVASQIFPFINRHIAERELAAAAYAVDEMQRVGHIAAGQQGEQSDLLDDLARIYATIPVLPVTAETAEEATNALLAFCYLPAVRKALDLQILPPAPLGDAEDYLRPLRNAIGTADAYATGGPRSLRIVTLRMDEAEAMLARASLATPQPPKPANGDIVRAAIATLRDMPTDRIEYNDELSALIRKLKPAPPKPAGAVPAWFGELPAPISNPEAWPANYAGGYNDALNMCYDVIRGHAPPQPMTTQGEAVDVEAMVCRSNDLVLVPRGLLGSACSAIDKKRDAPKTLEALRAITMSHPAAPDSEDAARLDWLDSQEADVRFHRDHDLAGDGEYLIMVRIVKGEKSISGHPLGYVRDAIDAARKTTGGQTDA